MPQNLLDHHIFLDERDDLHLAPTLRTLQRINLVHAFNQRAQVMRHFRLKAVSGSLCPGAATLFPFFSCIPRFLFELPPVNTVI